MPARKYTKKTYCSNVMDLFALLIGESKIKIKPIEPECVKENNSTGAHGHLICYGQAWHQPILNLKSVIIRAHTHSNNNNSKILTKIGWHQQAEIETREDRTNTNDYSMMFCQEKTNTNKESKNTDTMPDI
jgi:hypothetical protein